MLTGAVVVWQASVQRSASLQALEAADAERAATAVVIATLGCEVALQEATHPAAHVPASNLPAGSVPAGPQHRAGGAATTITAAVEDLERTLARKEKAHAEQLVKTAAALEAEAQARGELQFSEERRQCEAETARRQLAGLQREMQLLKRHHGGGGGGMAATGCASAAGTATAAAAIDGLSTEQMKRELMNQHACLESMSESLEAAEGRVRELERYVDLSRLADDEPEQEGDT